MSTLTSLVKSGKRRIAKPRTDSADASKTAPGLPDGGVPQEPTRRQGKTRVASNVAKLGLPDRGVSRDPMRPEDDAPGSGNMTVLGLPDRGVSHDPMRPEDDRVKRD